MLMGGRWHPNVLTRHGATSKMHPLPSSRSSIPQAAITSAGPSWPGGVGNQKPSPTPVGQRLMKVFWWALIRTKLKSLLVSLNFRKPLVNYLMVLMLGLRLLPNKDASITFVNLQPTQVVMHTPNRTLAKPAVIRVVGRCFYRVRVCVKWVRMLLVWSFVCSVIILLISMEGLLLTLLSMGTFINKMLIELAAHARTLRPWRMPSFTGLPIRR